MTHELAIQCLVGPPKPRKPRRILTVEELMQRRGRIAEQYLRVVRRMERLAVKRDRLQCRLERIEKRVLRAQRTERMASESR